MNADIPPSNIFNYDETNITDNPGSKLVITIRGRNRVERKVHHSKSLISIMFTGSAAGTFLPPMVVYKSEIKYREWIRGGPVNTVYDCTKNGWFNGPTFETWFFKQFVPSIVDLSGQIVLIGDNLGSHFSSRVLEYCSKNNIFYLFTTKLNTHMSTIRCCSIQACKNRMV